VKYSKNPNTSTVGARSALLYRLHLDQFEAYDTNPGVLDFAVWPVPANSIIYRPPRIVYEERRLTNVFSNLDPSENISFVQVGLADEYGQAYYSMEPQIIDITGGTAYDVEYDDFNRGLWYDLSFVTEI
jgi:hypothetical protein